MSNAETRPSWMSTALRVHELPALVQQVIQSLPVSPDVAPDDEMFEGHQRHYFGVGRSVLLGIVSALVGRLGFAGGDLPIKSVMDFGCGHGRVTRHLRAAFPDARIEVTDNAKSGVDWCVNRLGCVEVTELQPLRYDLVCLSSVLTHLPEDQTLDLLHAVKQSLQVNGVAIITTQGRFPCARLERFINGQTMPAYEHYNLPVPYAQAIVTDYMRHGFGYHDYPNQAGYGIALGVPGWYIERIVDSQTTMLLVQEMGTDAHQDTLAFMRLPDSILTAQRGAYFET